MNQDEPIRGLYPFLYGNKKDPVREREALLASVSHKVEESITIKQKFFDQYGSELVVMAEALAGVFAQGGVLFTMGNGGSSCDADHLAVEFMHPITTGRPALRAHSLTVDQSMLTAVGNDIGFAHVFLRQLSALGQTKDAIFGFSTSGNSKNLIVAYQKARDLGMRTFGLAGMEGGAMRESRLVDHLLVVPSDSVHRIQESHVTAYHILWDLVHTLLADHRGKLDKEI
ncbi:D-sedoheptulose-7-phosphate isomerase [Acidithiobacillus caldus]|nr:SIS domain-containing protein [Acidithiobacillus caldus]MBU2730754.1 SIS domain-containing protein [Acidithiobacillus caldus]MBU2735714.1 SIS domain-containing protein [Acidithiobacillus caldus ATCC 51756]MBU2744703.1 SIS domain-containing protein [Acidithiobacillus caldus]MBU2764017.1 SIS domain-containing protein [Acidithiobacillus caldus]MBU2769929.1 SIS domain-containing protein [Acidithiobacillus caldus]